MAESQLFTNETKNYIRNDAESNKNQLRNEQFEDL